MRYRLYGSDPAARKRRDAMRALLERPEGLAAELGNTGARTRLRQKPLPRSACATEATAFEKPALAESADLEKRARKSIFAGIACRYRELKASLKTLLDGGHQDYGRLTGLSQEIGRIRKKIREDIAAVREQRRLRRAAKKPGGAG